MHGNINECSSSTEGSHFCFAPALCEWRKRTKRRMRSLSCPCCWAERRRGAVRRHQWCYRADGCTACDQPPLDRARRCLNLLRSTLFLQPFQSLWILPNLNLFTSYKRTNHSHLPTNSTVLQLKMLINLLIFTQQGDLRFTHKLGR